MASCAPNARSLDCERLEHDPDDLDRNGERARRNQRSRLSGSMTNAKNITPSDPERSELYGERTLKLSIVPVLSLTKSMETLIIGSKL